MYAAGTAGRETANLLLGRAVEDEEIVAFPRPRAITGLNADAHNKEPGIRRQAKTSGNVRAIGGPRVGPNHIAEVDGRLTVEGSNISRADCYYPARRVVGRANHPHDGLAVPGNRNPVTAHAAGNYQSPGERGIIAVLNGPVKGRLC